MVADPLTPNLGLDLIPASGLNWSQKMNDNLTLLDSIIGTYFTVEQLRGIWQNRTAYVVNDTAIDRDSGAVYKVTVAHTSASVPTTFAEDRAANPSYWIGYTSPARARGVWHSSTGYIINDFVVYGTKYAIAVQTHTSTSSFDNDVASGYWSVLIDLSGVLSNIMPTPSPGNANDFAVVNSTGDAYVLANAAASRVLLGFTSIGEIMSTATSQTIGRAAIAAQAANAALDSIVAAGPTAFGLSMLGAANEEEANALIIRDEIDIATAADFATLARDYARVNLLSYYSTGIPSGGGTFIHDPTSTAVIDNGMTFAAIVGRYRRRNVGQLTTKDFGILHTGTVSQLSRVQLWLNACWNEKCAAVVSADTSTSGIPCGGGTLYINTTGALGDTSFQDPWAHGGGEAPSGFVMIGEHQRYSVLGSLANPVVLSIGAVGSITGSGNAAGKVSFSQFTLNGSLHCWNLQTGPSLRNIRIFPISTLVPAYGVDSIAYPQWDTVDWNYGFIASQSNHMEISGVRIEPGTGSQGAFFTGAGNYQWRGGGVQGMALGVVGRASPYRSRPRINSNAYAVGYQITSASAPGYMFTCTVAGTSAGAEPAGYVTVDRANLTAYALGNRLILASNPTLIFVCTTAGTTAAAEPVGYAAAVPTTVVVDGSASFTAYTLATATLVDGTATFTTAALAARHRLIPGGVGIAVFLAQGLHFESVVGECFVFEDGDQININSNHIRGTLTNPHTPTPLIRIGDAAISSSVCTSVSITENWFFSNTDKDDTGVDIQRAGNIVVKDNRFQNFDTGVTTLNSPGTGFPVTGFHVQNNYMSNVDIPYAVTALTQMVQEEAINRRPVVLSSSTFAWNMDISPIATGITNGAGESIPNPTEYVVGNEYILYLSKTNAGDTVTSWGSLFVFDGLVAGTGPTFAAMAVSPTFAEIRLRCITIGVTTYLAATYGIKGA